MSDRKGEGRDAEFDRLMEQYGVERLPEDPRRQESPANESAPGRETPANPPPAAPPHHSEHIAGGTTPPPATSPPPERREAEQREPSAPGSGAANAPDVRARAEEPASPPSTDPRLPVAIPPGAPDTARESDRRIKAFEAEREGLREQLSSAGRERDAAREKIDRLTSQRDALERERRSLDSRANRRKPEERPRAVAVPLPGLLDERGVPQSEEARCVSLLCSGPHSNRFTRLLRTEDPGALREMLEEHIALVCGEERCRPAGGPAVLQVKKDQCDVCSGFDLSQVADEFLNTCFKAHLLDVRIIGGSPAGEAHLGRLLRGDPRIRPMLAPGMEARTKQQVHSDLDHADLIVIWGTSHQRHAVSELYPASHAKVCRIPQRGVGRTLRLASEWIEKRGV